MRLPYRIHIGHVVQSGREPWPEEEMSQSQGQEDSVTEVATETQRVYKTVLFNDESHTYDYVVEMLTACCELSRDAAFRCALEVDLSGKTIVHYGGHEDCLARAQKITNFGPDHRLPHSVGSMSAEVQSH